jgi:hypothetical protein
VGWYLRFSLSYRDVEELLAERRLHADHVTVWRWVQLINVRKRLGADEHLQLSDLILVSMVSFRASMP